MVLDNGPGILPMCFPICLRPLFRTRLDARGTGLGLTVAEGIVSQHGGTISASNRPEGGASLEVLLPAGSVVFLMQRSLSNEGTALATGLIDVAVLDDDIDFLTYIEDLLRDEAGYTVRTFAHPDELFAAAEARLPDILLLDMKMGAATGR